MQGEKVQKYGATAWIIIWMWPLFGPVIATVRGRAHPVAPAALGLLAFALLYIAVVSMSWTRRTTGRGIVFVLLGILTALGLALAIGYAKQPDSWLILLLFVSVGGAAAFGPAQYVFAWLVLVEATLVVVGVATGQDDSYLGSIVFSTFLSGLLMFGGKRMSLLIEQLRSTQAELARAAVAEERLRFSRDLHDLLGHTLSLIVVKAEVVRRLGDRDPGLAAREAADIEQIGRRALVEVREAVTGYRERPFATELDGARTALAGAGIEVAIRETGGALPPAADDVFGWAVREGVTNVIRHSGARRCEIDVRRLDGHATLEIRDDGVGCIAMNKTGYGLRGLAERVRALGGTVDIGPVEAGGFRLAATIPVRDGARGQSAKADGVPTKAAQATASGQSGSGAPDREPATR